MFPYYSETRNLSEDQSSGDDVSGHINPGLGSCPAAALQPRRRQAKRTRKKVEKCLVCQKGFAFWRDPPLQKQCSKCKRFIHIKCIRFIHEENNFLCQSCSSHPPSSTSQHSSTADLSPQLSPSPCLEPEYSPAPATIQCSLDEMSDVLLSSTNKPSYRDHLTLLDSKLAPLGFTRSQLTPADGNCLIHG